MPPFVLTVLKFVFLALLYFFVYRAVRSVAVDMRGTSTAPGRDARAPSIPARQQARSAKAKPPRELVVLDESGKKVNTMALDGSLQIGRAEACQIQCQDNYVSSFHARIFPRDGQWFVEDLGSTNGTYLNQRRVTAPSELRAGDRVRVGKTVMELRR
jgi:pSer/pThr/pTyr-binding forkhead associated (FHA) protein